MVKDDFLADFPDFPDFIAALQLAKSNEHSDMIVNFVQKLNREHHGLKVCRD